MNIWLELATNKTRDIVRHYFLQFFYALSEYDPLIYINDFGLPIYKPEGGPPAPGEGPRTPAQAIRANWWVRGKCEQYIIRANGRPAGSVLIAVELPHLPPDVNLELMDFYIAPPYRRQGIGRAAAKLALDLHHGSWIVYQLQRNEPAKAFWRSVIREHTRGNFVEQQTDYDVSQRFDTRTPWRHAA